MEGGGEWPGTCAHDERCPASGGLGTSCTDPDASLQQVDEVVSRSTVFVPHLNFNLDAVLRDRSTTSTNITRTDPEVEVRGVAATASSRRQRGVKMWGEVSLPMAGICGGAVFTTQTFLYNFRWKLCTLVHFLGCIYSSWAPVFKLKIYAQPSTEIC